MASTLRWLNDPTLVCSFQRLCGIVPRKLKHTNGKSVIQNEDPTPEPAWPEHAEGPDHADLQCSHTNDNVGDSLSSNATEINSNYVRKRIPNTHSIGAENDVHIYCKNEIKSNECENYINNNDHVDDVSESSSEDDSDAAVDYVITNKILHYIFEFGASLGNEMFYITFFPFWFWNIDGYVGRRVCMFWCLFMYLGQATKDIVKWPRPASPPVMRLELRYALEYGMPSTHAMVGAGLPVSLLVLTYDRYEYPVWIGLLICVTWCGLVCGSRIYLGMHTVLDVLAGLAYVFALMVICFPYLDAADHFVLTNRYAPVALVLIPLVLSLCYPTLDKWSTARGDTTLILAVTGGLCLGNWLSYQYGFMQRATTSPPYQIIYPTWAWFGQMLMRLALGVVILIATRTIMKLLSYNLVCHVAGISAEDMKAHQKLSVELPYKFITYMVVGMTSVALAPQVFRYLGIERETFFTEI